MVNPKLNLILPHLQDIKRVLHGLFLIKPQDLNMEQMIDRGALDDLVILCDSNIYPFIERVKGEDYIKRTIDNGLKVMLKYNIINEVRQ